MDSNFTLNEEFPTSPLVSRNPGILVGGIPLAPIGYIGGRYGIPTMALIVFYAASKDPMDGVKEFMDPTPPVEAQPRAYATMGLLNMAGGREG
ncbi:MAG: hypothetical protein QXE79_05610 [Candidatus Bathyarchaeia archaeon]